MVYAATLLGYRSFVARKSARKERERLIEVMRAEGMTWVQIAEDFRDRYQVNARVAMRWAHGWTQAKVAELWSLTFDDPKTSWNISVWETWPHSGHAPPLPVLDRLAQLYQCDVADLVGDIGRYRHLDPANTASTIRSVRELAKQTPAVATEDNDHHDGDVHRRDFTRAAALSALGLADPLRALIAIDSPNLEVIGAEHVELVRSALDRSGKHDAVQGSAKLRPAVAVLRDQVESWLSGRYSVDRGVSSELQGALGELYAWSGWLAHDDNDPSAAIRLVKDTLVQARIIDDPRLEVRALALLAGHLLKPERPHEALNCAEAAQRAAQGWATPRVSALVHLRAAQAHADLGESGAFGREIAKAMHHLDKGQHPDDPPFIHFMTAQELAGLRGVCLQVLGKPDRAVREFQSIVDDPDPTYRRNLALYTIDLAQALAQNRDITAAADTGLSAMDLVGELESSRTTRHLAGLRLILEPHRAGPTARDFLERYDQEFTPA